MLTHTLTPRSKTFKRVVVFFAAGCLLSLLLSNFTASARNAEPGLWRRLFTAPVTTVQQVFGRAMSPAAAPVPMPAAPAMLATITVNSTADGTLATLAANATCDLREAIEAANTNAAVGQCAAGTAGLDNIVFNLGAGTPSIALADALPAINEPININGATGGSTRVELNGTSVPAGLNALTIFAGSSTIQSLVINRFSGNARGIYFGTNGDNTVKNCYIGTNAAGTAISANGGDGIWIDDTPNNTIGGATAADRNIISGNGTPNNGGSAIFISGTLATGNKIIGNYLGTDVTGTVALPNVDNGVFMRAANNTIERNLISGNNFDGIFIQTPQASGNRIIGNFIGTNAAGTAALGNKNDGVLLSNAPNNIVGGTTPAERNIISGNGIAGAGNRGVWLYDTNATGNKIIGNYIGTDVTGTIAIPNNDHGVMMQDAPNNWIGGTAPGEGNIIAGNAKTGVRVIPNDNKTAIGNRILGNSIFNNALRGIALSVDNFPEPNDPMDADTGDDPSNPGGNHLQNYPVLSCAVSGGGMTTIRGSLNSLATTSFRIEFFSNDACHETGNGEGKTYLGFQNVTTNASGDATINATVAASVTPGQVVTATATLLDSAGNPVETSEFSACQSVIAAPTLAINDVALIEGNAGTTNAVFTVTLSGAQASCVPVTVNFATADNTALLANNDYANTSGMLTFNTPHASATITQTISVPVNGDMTVEANETFFVNLTSPTGATITDAQGVGTINNDDTTELAINDVAVTEGNSGTVNATFTVSLTKPSALPVTVQYQTANNTATAPSDYAAVALTTLTFNPLEVSKQITVVVNGDMTVEANETFFANLSNPSGATINDAQGVGTINNDDATTVAINDVAVSEGNSGTVNANFNVTLSKPSAEQVTVSYATANGTATTGDNDYAAASGTVTFAAGETSKPVAVTVNGDTKVEANETFNVNLSNIVGNDANVPDPTMGDAQGVGTINNDDAATIAINDVMVVEGNSGTVNAVFSVSLSAVVDQPVVINYATANGTATIANGDYAAAAGTVTFAAGSTTAQTITVLVNGDTSFEPDETFVVNLTPNSLPYAGVTIADNQGIGTIKNDDPDKVPPFSATMTEPLVCNGIGGSVLVTAQLTNPFNTAQPATFAVTLPSVLTAVPGSCTATTGNCTITPPNQIAWSGTLAADQTVTIQYQAKIADGTPDGQLIVINSTGSVNAVSVKASASGTVSCPANNLNNPPTDVDVSAQKPGSLLVFPYYTSRAGTKADTRLQLSNVGKSQAYVHLFFVDGTSCQQSDMFICLTPNASFAFRASEYDPEVTGWFMAVVVDGNGHPTRNNSLIGNAFVQEGDYADTYGAEAFWAHSDQVATVSGNTALLRFDGVGYDPVPSQFAVELQSPFDAVGQRIVTVGLNGDLTASRMTGAGQVGPGLIYNGNENPFASFSSFLLGNCQAQATVSATNPRVPGAMTKLIPTGQVGTMKLNVGAGVGLLMTPRTGSNKWSGIRALHKTNTTFSTIRIPVFIPQC
jgi:parallel beta-helix repeat protein